MFRSKLANLCVFPGETIIDTANAYTLTLRNQPIRYIYLKAYAWQPGAGQEVVRCSCSCSCACSCSCSCCLRCACFCSCSCLCSSSSSSSSASFSSSSSSSLFLFLFLFLLFALCLFVFLFWFVFFFFCFFFFFLFFLCLLWILFGWLLCACSGPSIHLMTLLGPCSAQLGPILGPC